MDNVEQTNEENSELQKNGVVDIEKEQTLASLDAIQQHNDQYFENHGNIHKPIPKDLGILKLSSGHPSYFIYFDPRSVMNPLPSNSHMHHEPRNKNVAHKSFHEHRVPPLFNDLTNILRMHHIAAFEEGRSHSEKNRVHQSQLMNTMNFIPLLWNPANAPSRFGVVTGDGLQKSIGGISWMSLNAEPKNGLSTESVVKGKMLIANITHDNRTDPADKMVPGSVLSQDFDFKIPIPALSADSKESKYLKKTDRSKYNKGSGRFRNLYTKRRRNGVRNDFRKCDPWTGDCTTLHGKITQTHIRRKANHALKSKTARKDLNNLGYVRVRYVKDDYEPMYDSSEISDSAMSSENMPAHSQAHEYNPKDVDSEMKNFTAEYETESSESSSDVAFNGPRSRRDIEASPFCPIPKDSRNGDMDCTIWSYKKTCTLICHNGYTSPNRHFTCQRSKNVWVPQMVPCKGGPEYEPAEETRVQLKQLDGNDYEEEEEPQPPPRAEADSKDDVESSSAEMGVRDQGGEEDEVLPVNARAHKKGLLNKEGYGEKSGGETGARKKAHLKKVKKQDEHRKDVEDAPKVHKAQEKGEPKPSKQTQNEDEDAWKEETGDDVPKTGSAEEQSADESSNEEDDETPKDEEIAHNDVEEVEYDERRK